MSIMGVLSGFSWSWSFSKIRITISLFQDIGSTFLKIAVNISSQSLTLFDHVTFMDLEIFHNQHNFLRPRRDFFDFWAIFLYPYDFSKITLLRFEWSLSIKIKTKAPTLLHQLHFLFFRSGSFSLSSTFQKARGNRDQNQPSLFIKIKNPYKHLRPPTLTFSKTL